MVGGGVKDSLNVPSRRSRDNAYELTVPDDGICTMRAESHLEANNMLQNLRAKKAATNSTSGVRSGVQQTTNL